MEVNMTQCMQLAPDGTYSNGSSHISGYDSLSASFKDRFLRDARSLLKQTQQILTKAGWSEYMICVNPAGVAVSGDVFADFWTPADPFNIVYCTIGASAVHFGGRKDGVVIMARQEKREIDRFARRSKSKPSYRTTWMGINQWIDPGVNSRELAVRLLQIAGAPESGEQRELPGCVYHSTTAGAVPVPSGLLRNREGTLAWSAALEQVFEAGQADAAIHTAEVAGSKKEPVFHQLTLLESFGNPEVQGGKHV
jgi:hypothetical protein